MKDFERSKRRRSNIFKVAKHLFSFSTYKFSNGRYTTTSFRFTQFLLNYLWVTCFQRLVQYEKWQTTETA